MTYKEIVELARSMGCDDVWRNDGCLPFKIRYNHRSFLLNKKDNTYIRIFMWDKNHNLTYKDSVVSAYDNNVKIKPKDLEYVIKHNIKILKEIDVQNKMKQIKEDFE